MFITTQEDGVMEIDAKSDLAKKIKKVLGQFSLEMHSEASEHSVPGNE